MTHARKVARFYNDETDTMLTFGATADDSFVIIGDGLGGFKFLDVRGATADDSFAIIGDDSLVNDDTILALWNREKVAGWKRLR